MVSRNLSVWKNIYKGKKGQREEDIQWQEDAMEQWKCHCGGSKGRILWQCRGNERNGGHMTSTTFWIMLQ